MLKINLKVKPQILSSLVFSSYNKKSHNMVQHKTCFKTSDTKKVLGRNQPT